MSLHTQRGMTLLKVCVLIYWISQRGVTRNNWLCDDCCHKVYRYSMNITMELSLLPGYQINAHFLYSITTYMLHYNPQHVSSSTLLILRRTNCIITASGIVCLCKRPYGMPVESGLQSALNRHTVRPFTERHDTRGCNNTICPSEDEQGTARNMLRIIM